MFATPEDAELSFYDAFARGDIESMREIWLDDDSIVCIHPGSDILNGRTSVHASWAEILQSPPAIRHEIESRSRGPLLAVHIGREWVPTGPDQVAVLAVTNVFQITPVGWRMLAHHGSGLDLGSASTAGRPVH